LTEKWLCENTVISILDYIEYARHNLTRACEIEHDNLKQSRVKMKKRYDKDVMIRSFKPGEKVTVLLPIHCQPVQATYVWPDVNESRLHDLNYIVNTHTRRRKKTICQVTTQGFSKEYKLIVDANGVGVGAVLLQEGKDAIYLLKCYFSLKFERDQKNKFAIAEKHDLSYFYL
jgi:hypothetical protein